MKFHWYLKLYYEFIFKSGFTKFINCVDRDRFAISKPTFIIAL